jgi:hypothetical protein
MEFMNAKPRINLASMLVHLFISYGSNKLKKRISSNHFDLVGSKRPKNQYFISFLQYNISEKSDIDVNLGEILNKK